MVDGPAGGQGRDYPGGVLEGIVKVHAPNFSFAFLFLDTHPKESETKK